MFHHRYNVWKDSLVSFTSHLWLMYGKKKDAMFVCVWKPLKCPIVPVNGPKKKAKQTTTIQLTHVSGSFWEKKFSTIFND